MKNISINEIIKTFVVKDVEFESILQETMHDDTIRVEMLMEGMEVTYIVKTNTDDYDDDDYYQEEEREYCDVEEIERVLSSYYDVKILGWHSARDYDDIWIEFEESYNNV